MLNTVAGGAVRRLADDMRALDALETINGERPGGGLKELDELATSLETHILATVSSTVEERLWKVRRLARATANEWSTMAVLPLLKSIEADFVAAPMPQPA